MPTKLRTLYQADISQLLAIERAVHISPWTLETFAQCFAAHCQGWGIVINNKIIGFIMVSMASLECHILNLCITHAYQRQGFGRLLIQHALQSAKTQGIEVAYLEVRKSNHPAITLYKSLGFEVIGERKNYYVTVNGAEDAFIYAKLLDK